jgi:hypothetical protein
MMTTETFDPEIPATEIKPDDLRRKMDELSNAVSRTMVEHQTRRYTTALMVTVGGIWIAYRLGRRRGRRESRL